MSQNILITGAAGYIGPIKAANIIAVVRSEEQVQSLSKLGVKVIQVDLSNEAAVKEAVVSNESAFTYQNDREDGATRVVLVDVVIHRASAIDSRIVSALIKALGRRRELSGEETDFMHSSVATVFSAEGGWPYGEVRDTDPIFEKGKEIADTHPIRKTNVLVTELANAQGVTSFIIAVPQVYGKGIGEWRKPSVTIPAYIRASMKHKVVYKFDNDGSPPSAHVSDLVALYALLTEKILQKEPIPRGEKGYYFAMAHRTHRWTVMQLLAKLLYARGLVAEPKAEIWPSEDMAAECLGFPRLYVRTMGTSSGQLVPVNVGRLGWQPKWDEERFTDSLNDEIQAVQELDTVMSSLFDVLLPMNEQTFPNWRTADFGRDGHDY